jgi:phosphatidylglycerophosphatase A
MKSFARFALTAGGLGLLRPAPGTWGSLPPVVAACALAVAGAPDWSIDGALMVLALAGTLACLAYGNQGEAIFGKKDPGAVVADEVAGQAITLLLLPWDGTVRQALIMGAIGFFAFRIADIVKPWPARGLQRLEGGLGILIDDLIAGVYALIVTQLAVRYGLPLLG